MSYRITNKYTTAQLAAIYVEYSKHQKDLDYFKRVYGINSKRKLNIIFEFVKNCIERGEKVPRGYKTNNYDVELYNLVNSYE